MVTEISNEELREAIISKIKRTFGRTLDEATKEQVYKACALTLQELITSEWADANNEAEKLGKKRLYYLSAEFLMGRALVNNMISMNLLVQYKQVLEELGFDLNEIEEQENDAGLGNGGLGRLAAGFLDSLSTLNYPATGCSIRYEFGLFKQRILDGEQVEVDDNWLERGNVWEIARPEDQVEVKYGGKIEEHWIDGGLQINHIDYNSVVAIPYDYPVMGYESKMPSTLRLWSAKAKTELDMHYFNRGDYSRAVQERELAEIISKVLYPDDNHEQGRLLRLKQFYFFVSASMQNMVREHKELYGDVRSLPKYAVVQINDTHPTLAIPELMRILMDEEHLSWDEAYGIVSNIFNYTNHTIMTEALECWNVDMFKNLLPRIYQIIDTINEKFCENLWTKFPGDWDRISRMSIVSYDEIRMANLCIAVCKKVNGVSKLHGEILKTRTFRDFYVAFPDKFLGITNGITHRRWLAKANQPLTELLESYIGDGFLKDYRELHRVIDLIDNRQFLDDFMDARFQNKLNLKAHLQKKQGVEIDVNTVFDVHAKRLHEYKRQLLKALHILHLYKLRKQDPHANITPCTFMFAAKASPGYFRAKNIIRLILAIADLVNNDPDTRDVIKVVFIENYGVSEAEMLIPAADISEQISTAGLEASGTSNMKFMLNGAVTLGTMDGANVEIYEQVGPENIFIFGATVEEISRMERYGSYHPGEIYEQNTDLRIALNSLIDGTLNVQSDRQFSDLYHSLLFGDSERADKYFLLYDFNSYDQAFISAMNAYNDRPRWQRMSAINTAQSYVFCSDRTVEEYNDYVWHLQKI